MLKTWEQIEDKHLVEIIEFIQKRQTLTAKFEREKIQPLGFNVFEIVSDTYRRENFHSYLICNLLSPFYNNEGQLFITELINCLNVLTKNKIQHNDFTAPVVEREKDRIDIRIRDSISRKSIIIENKINDAIDQDNQIPRYYKSETDSNFEVVGIVYLTLTEGKTPDKTSWNTDNKTKIKIDDALIYLTASKNNEEINLLTWIDKCINISTQIDVISTLRQYKALIKHLREKEINYVLMEEFYNLTKESDKYKTALSIRNMLGKLNEFRTNNLKKCFDTEENRALFNKITCFIWSKEYRVKFEDSKFENIKFWIDVVCVENETRVYFHEENSTFKDERDKIKILLENIEEFKGFIPSSTQAYFRVFEFPNEEDELIQFLKNVFTKLREIKEMAFFNKIK